MVFGDQGMLAAEIGITDKAMSTTSRQFLKMIAAALAAMIVFPGDLIAENPKLIDKPNVLT